MLPINDYKHIAANMPILCVDMVAVKDGKYLLVKRDNNPLKGQWWVPGGRMLRGETPEEAVHRKMKEEVGLDVNIISRIGFYNEIFTENELDIDYVHTLSVVFIVSVKDGEVKLDKQSTEYKWADSLPDKVVSQVFSL